MRIIVAGSRSIDSYALVKNSIMESGWVDRETEIVSGEARGVDTHAITFAYLANLPCHRFPANWNKYGKGAGMIRNREMVEFSDALIAIWDGRSKGTKAMIDIATKRGLRVFVKRIDIGTILMGLIYQSHLKGVENDKDNHNH